MNTDRGYNIAYELSGQALSAQTAFQADADVDSELNADAGQNLKNIQGLPTTEPPSLTSLSLMRKKKPRGFPEHSVRNQAERPRLLSIFHACIFCPDV